MTSPSPAAKEVLAKSARKGARPSKELETFTNPRLGREYEISFECPEFTCVCPMTGQPDFGTIRIRYVPDERCVELKSLKLYLWSFRDEGAFHEEVTNQVLDDLVAAMSPRKIRVEGDFAVRGGIHTVVTVTHEKPARGSKQRSEARVRARRGRPAR
ncbi:MAG: NADPH-dependent 7-cyano-7-deazaguanine reductase QueF [Deltaproteobacteria bacterium]|nr:NADPH-dependent 7-cyano-7-deazaguanine reductase QueF [Deltaproteobacteria bacterium]